VDSIITRLVRRFDSGGLTRRELIQGLSFLAAGAAATPAAAQQNTFGFRVTGLDHVQINSADVRRSSEFYQKVLGLTELRVGPASDPKCCPDEQSFLFDGGGTTLLLAVRKMSPSGVVDHIGYRMSGNREAFARTMQERGVKRPASGQYGDLVDPDGIRIQPMWY